MLAVHIALLLLLVGDVLAAVAPGDEHAECEVPTDYLPRTILLLDSWRYQTLLAQDQDGATTGSAVWTAVNTADMTQIFTVHQNITVSQNSHSS